MLDPETQTQAQSALAHWKEIADLVKAVLESLAIVAGALVIAKWFTARHDRATDILLQLETRFQDPEIQSACRILEDDDEYLTAAPSFQHAVRTAANLWPDNDTNETTPNGASLVQNSLGLVLTDLASSNAPTTNCFAAIDKLLRFYMLMHGFRKARQVPDAPLRVCYRYWLAHYFHLRRPEFRAYVDQFYPTLRAWLACESRWYKRSPARPLRFFRAADFWKTKPKDINERLREATQGRVLVIAGAGLSAESGIPTFRGRGGLWRGYDPKELATKEAFKDHPEQVWEFYRDRRRKVRASKPNNAHKALLALSKRVSKAGDFLVVTQNVDHYEIDAGLDPKRVVQIHGDILTTRCHNAKCRYRRREVGLNSDDSETKCPLCDTYLRPDVVWFDEEFRPGDEERVKAFIAEGLCDVVFVIGTSATFSYIADWALTAVKPTGWLIEINPKPSDIARFAHHVRRGKAGKVLPKLLKQLSKGEPPKRLTAK